jgi:hypothetical protein
MRSELIDNLLSKIMSANLWYTRVNVKALGGEISRLILKRVKGKPRFTKTLKGLGISRDLLYNYLNWVGRVPDEVIVKAYDTLTRQNSTR